MIMRVLWLALFRMVFDHHCENQVTIIWKKNTIYCNKFAKEWTSKHTGLFISYVLDQELHPISSGKLQNSSFDIH